MKFNVLLAFAAGCVIVGIVAFAYLHGAELRVLDPQGPVAFQEKSVIVTTVSLAAIVVVPLFMLLFAFAWRYRATSIESKIEHAPNWDHDNWIAEAVWWMVPAVIVLFLAIIAYQSTTALDPFKRLAGTEPPMTIQVIALDWKWLFIYPAQGIATVNMIEIPKDTPVTFQITSDAPMNSFWVPSLGGQIMAMPGMMTQMNLLASTVGTYNGFSANISGDGFAGMAFTVKSVDETDFMKWVQSVHATSNPLNASTYATLAAPSEYVPPMYFSSIDQELYTVNVMKYMMPPMHAPQSTQENQSMQGMQM